MPGDRKNPITFPRIQERVGRRIAFIGFLLCLLYFLFCSILSAAALIVYHQSAAEPENLGALLISFLPIILLVSSAITALHWMAVRKKGIEGLLASMGAEKPESDDAYHKRFQNIVEEFSAASGLSGVRPFVVKEAYLNAFALDDGRGGRAVAVTEGLISNLTRPQLQGVVAHEFAHLVRRDSQTATLAVSMLGTIELALETTLKMFGGTSRSTGRAVARRPNVVFLWLGLVATIWFMRLATRLLYLALSRKTEELADVTAVEILRDPVSLAQALAVIRRNKGLAFRGFRPMGPLYIAETSPPGFFGSLFSTHPPPLQRIRTLMALAKLPPSAVYRGIRRKRRGQTIFAKLDYKGEPILWTGVKEGGLSAIISDAGGGGSCPRCGDGLAQIPYEGVKVEACGGCGGKLVSAKNLPKILIREESDFDEGLKKLAERHEEQTGRLTGKMKTPRSLDASADLSCPKCRKTLWRRFINHNHMVVVDYCGPCGLYWFDANELEILQILTEELRDMQKKAARL